MKILEVDYPIIQIHRFYTHSLTRCLGLPSKMCARQMNTSDNPELWGIQLSSWLFCELIRRLCSWLLASSCYFKTSHAMYVEGLYYDSRLGIWCTRGLSPGFTGRLSVTKPKPCTIDHWWRSADFMCTTLHTCAYHNTHYRYRKQFTDRTDSDSRLPLFCNL